MILAKLSLSRLGSKDPHKRSYPPSSALAWLSTSSPLARRPVRPRDTDLPFVRTSSMARRVSHVGGPLGGLPVCQIDVQLVSNNNRDEVEKERIGSRYDATGCDLDLSSVIGVIAIRPNSGWIAKRARPPESSWSSSKRRSCR